MPQAPVLTEKVRGLITRIYLQDKTQRAKEVLDKVHAELGRNDWPKLSVIQREIKRTNDNDTAEFREKDELWHLGLMDKYNVSPEALPYIGMLQNWAETHLDSFGQSHKPLTIRQALWVARLYATIDTSWLKNKKKMLQAASFLWRWSEAYAQREIVCKLMGKPFVDTSELDRAFREGAQPITVGKTILAFYPDNSFSIDTADKKLLRQMKKEGAK